MSSSWTAEMECALFYSMIDHKPVGENKHFHIIFTYEKFNNLNEKNLSTSQLCEHLGQLYDLKELNENETKPFPNDGTTEFLLPDSIPKLALNQNSSSSESKSNDTPKSVLRTKTNSNRSTNNRSRYDRHTK